MSFDASKPTSNGLLINAPQQIRNNWDAIALGTDSDLLITNAKVATNAAIADSKLAQITTAAKVSGTALTLLPNIPSGAGTLPLANIPSSIPDSKLAQIATASKVSGAAITSLASVPSGAGILPVANVDVGTSANKIVQLDASAKLPAVDGSQLTNVGSYSNVIFNYVGVSNVAAKYVGTILNALNGAQSYDYLFRATLGKDVVMTGKWKKIAGINTVTAVAKMWKGVYTPYTYEWVKLYVKIDTIENNFEIPYTTNQTSPTWMSPITLDVSSLSNGTIYDIIISMENGAISADSCNCYCSNITLFGS